MKFVIAKFELYPSTNPTGYAVGFDVTTSNGRNFYRDTVVSLESCLGKTDEEIISLAYSALETNIMGEVNQIKNKSDLLGKEWTPIDTGLADIDPPKTKKINLPIADIIMPDITMPENPSVD